ncbi:hypothetical protein Dxin01_03222 [Deinococcus xinjiangensis]|uniref:HTH cro/C1-type domain-containing protein n=1 Tax=Deinococcus xinjiangensis TaxID=457454 RepID=A0ABP9VE04_9DEIO
MEHLADRTTFGPALGMRRRLLGISRASLAKQADITPELLAALESGEVESSHLHLYAKKTLERVLDITL